MTDRHIQSFYDLEDVGREKEKPGETIVTMPEQYIMVG